jgi:hypothetical protein
MYLKNSTCNIPSYCLQREESPKKAAPREEKTAQSAKAKVLVRTGAHQVAGKVQNTNYQMNSFRSVNIGFDKV